MPREVQLSLATILSGPKGVNAVAKQIQNGLRGITADVKINVSRNASQSLDAIANRLEKVSRAAVNANNSIGNLNKSLADLSSAFQRINAASSQTANNLKAFDNIAKASGRHSKGVQVFANRFELLGDRVGLAAKRLGAFSLAFRPLIAISNILDTAVKEAVEFQDQMVRLTQIVGGKTIRDVSALNNQIRGLATQFGVSSKDLTGIADTLLQAGLKANETRLALNALAKVPLAPTFDSMEQAGEGLIAMMGQFNVTADQFNRRLSQINTLSARYAVESSDLINAVRKSGASFAGAGGNLEELLALFTAVRSSSRESADTIATSFRTIFARLQRPGTVNFLEGLGIQLRDAQGSFVGPFNAILKIAEKLNKVNPQSQLFAQVVEEIGGIRQVNKVQTLLKQVTQAREALSVAQNAGNSLDDDAAKRQQSLAIQLNKLNEAIKNVFKTLATDQTFLAFTESILSAATAVAKLVEQLTPLAPLILSVSAIGIAGKIGSFTQGFGRRLVGMAGGGQVGGSGNRDSELAMLMPGEFVVNKRAVNKIGVENLHRLNEGRVGHFAKGTPRKKQYSNFNDLSKDLVDELALKAGLNEAQRKSMLRNVGHRGSTPPRPFEVGGRSYVTAEQAAGGYGESRIKFDQIAILKKQNQVAQEASIQEEEVVRQQKTRKKNLRKLARAEEQAILAQQNVAKNLNSMKSIRESVHHPLNWLSTSTALATTNAIRVPTGGFHGAAAMQQVQNQLQAAKNQLLLPYHPNVINVPTGGFALPPKTPPNLNLPVLSAKEVGLDKQKALLAARNATYRSTYYGGDAISAIRPGGSAGMDPLKSSVMSLTQAVKQTAGSLGTYNDSGLHKISSAQSGPIPGLYDLRRTRRSTTVDPLRANRLAAMSGGTIVSHYGNGIITGAAGGPNRNAGGVVSPIRGAAARRLGLRGDIGLGVNTPFERDYLAKPMQQMSSSRFNATVANVLGLNGGGMSAMNRGIAGSNMARRTATIYGNDMENSYVNSAYFGPNGPGGPPNGPNGPRRSWAYRAGRFTGGAGRLAGAGVNRLRDPRAAAALAIGSFAFGGDTPEGAAAQGGLGAASTALFLGANPLLAVGAGVLAGSSSYQDAKQNNDLSLFAKQLQARGPQSKALISGNRNLVNNLTSASELNNTESLITSLPAAYAGFKGFFNGQGSDVAEAKVYSQRVAQKRGQQLQKLQPELATQATQIQNEIQDMLGQGLTKEQIGKKVNLREFGFLTGAANTSNPEASLNELQKEGDRLVDEFFKLHEPASKVAQALQAMERELNMDIIKFQELGEKVQGLVENSANLTDLNSIFGGEYAPANIGGAGTALGKAAFGNLNDAGNRNAANSFFGSFGPVGKKLISDLTDVDVSERMLSKILADEAASASTTEDISSFTARVSERLNNEFATKTGRNLGAGARDALSLNFAQGLPDNATVADIKAKIQDPDFAANIFRDQRQALDGVRKTLGESIRDMGSRIHDTFSIVNSNLDKINDLAGRSIDVGTNIELTKRQFAKNDLVDVNLLQRGFLGRQSGLLNAAGVGKLNPLDVQGIFKARGAAQNRLVNARQAVNAASTPEQIAKAGEEFKAAEQSLKNLDKAVVNLTDNMDDLNKGPLARLDQISNEKNARLGIGEKLLGGSGLDMLAFLRRGLAAGQVIRQGNFNGLPQSVRQMALEGLNERAGTRINGRLVEDIKNDLIKNSLPGLIPKDLQAEEQQLQKQVIDNMGRQSDALNANMASIDLNTNELIATTNALNNLAVTMQNLPIPVNKAGGGFGARGTDTVPAMLTPGEFVINRRATQQFLPLLMKINSGAMNPDDIHYAQRGMRMPQGNRLRNDFRGDPRRFRNMLRRGIVDQQGNFNKAVRPLDVNERNLRRRGLTGARDAWLAQLGRGPGMGQGWRDFRRNFIRERRLSGSDTRSGRAAARRQARQQRLAMRGYATGGEVSGGGTIDTSWVAQYVSITNAHIQALNNFPRNITMTGTHQVNVVVNGADVMSSIQPLMQSLIDDAVNKATRGSYRGMDSDHSEVFRRLDGGLT